MMFAGFRFVLLIALVMSSMAPIVLGLPAAPNTDVPTPRGESLLMERSGTKLSQTQAAAKLKAAGITTVSSGGCTDKKKPSCTSLDGILSGTVDGAINLKKQSGANIVITGGTETGHASGNLRSHANGFKIDVQKNAVVDKFIKSTFKQIANRGDGFPQWKDTAGNLYCDEGNHWDITFL